MVRSISHESIIFLPFCLARNNSWNRSSVYFDVAFSALTMLVGRQEEHLACKSDEVMAWLSILSDLQEIAYGSSDATATPSSLALLKSRTV